jgi:hypothetical protein
MSRAEKNCATYEETKIMNRSVLRGSFTLTRV